MKKEQQQQKKNMKNETVTFVFSSSFPINIFFFFFLLFSFTHISVALQKSLEVMCRFITTMADERNYRDWRRWRDIYSYLY